MPNGGPTGRTAVATLINGNDPTMGCQRIHDLAHPVLAPTTSETVHHNKGKIPRVIARQMRDR